MADQYVESGIPFLRSQDILAGRIDVSRLKFISPAFHAKIKKSRLVPGDVGIVRTGYPGTAAVVPASLLEANCSDLVIARPGPELSPRYLAFLLNSPWGKAMVRGRLVGAAQQHFNVKVAQALEIPAPPIEVQSRIANVLGDYDDLIALNLRRVAILENMARGIFDEWFVRFRFPDHTNVPLIDTADGPLPEGWTVGTLADLVSQRRETTQPGPHLQGRAYVPVECIGRKTWALDSVLSWEEARSSLQLFNRGDILFGAMRAYFHKIAPAPTSGVTRSTCFVLRARDQQLAAYALLTLFQDETVAYASANSKGATIPYAQWSGVLERMKCVLPDPNTLERFQAVTQPIIDLVMSCWSINQSLTASRDLLLPRLVSGQLSVSAAEHDLKAA